MKSQSGNMQSGESSCEASVPWKPPSLTLKESSAYVRSREHRKASRSRSGSGRRRRRREGEHRSRSRRSRDRRSRRDNGDVRSIDQSKPQVPGISTQASASQNQEAFLGMLTQAVSRAVGVTPPAASYQVSPAFWPQILDVETSFPDSVRHLQLMGMLLCIPDILDTHLRICLAMGTPDISLISLHSLGIHPCSRCSQCTTTRHSTCHKCTTLMHRIRTILATLCLFLPCLLCVSLLACLLYAFGFIGKCKVLDGFHRYFRGFVPACSFRV
eukprot:symbB.v1.2.010087.t1/scaffold644.1/size179742/11